MENLRELAVLPRVPAPVVLGTYPTPVLRLDALSRPGCELWVKRDDLTNPEYGGNKVRKLEHVLAYAKARGAKRLVTLGAAGSHHVLATTIYGRAAGFSVEGVLVPQPRTAHVVEDLRANLAQGLVAFPAQSWAMVPLILLRRLGRDAYFVTAGGSTLEGAMGYVDAARELAAQVRAGTMPEPDLAVVTLGSGGTVAGLAAGFELEGLKTKVVAVCIAEPPWVIEWMALRLARRCLRSLGRSTAGVRDRIVFERRYRGAGYGHATPWGARATAIAARESLALDDTYTAKAFAAALDLVAARRAKTILYWHTLSSAPMEPLLRGAPREADLDLHLRRLLR